MAKRDFGVLERLESIIVVIEKDETACGLLDKLLACAEEYFVTVIDMETRLKISRSRMDGRSLHKLGERLEGKQSYIHEELVSAIRSFNSYVCENFRGRIPDGGVFSEDPEAVRDQEAVADWVGKLVMAVYRKRTR